MEPPSSNAGSPREVTVEDSASLDHTLLESLFFNEMVLMEDSSDTLATHVHSQQGSHSSLDASVLTDPDALVEKALLRDFGVTAAPMPLHGSLGKQPQQWPSTNGSQGQAIATNSGTTTQQSSVRLDVELGPVAQLQPGATPAVQAAGSGSEPRADDEKRTNLVDQFAVLASRLGITLPPQVMQSLSVKTANDGKSGDPVPSSSFVPRSLESATSTESDDIQNTGRCESRTEDRKASNISASDKAPVPSATTPLVKQLQSTAEEAIAAVSRKRSPPEDPASKVPVYSKRRKKPRLVDCENKLKQLKAENELLKGHLHNVTNQSHKLDQERQAQEQRMKGMLEQGASPEEIDAVVNRFTEMYSDYGKQRHRELSFHLEQLQRLLNPTNFTKMGLWTLGQQSHDPKRNPIAGLLVKELGITGSQSRKIIEQRQRIEAVCSNLKECQVLLGKLRALCKQKTQIFHDRMTKCREILSPRQVVKLLVWIEENSRVLGSVCPGWGSEHMQTSK